VKKYLKYVGTRERKSERRELSIVDKGQESQIEDGRKVTEKEMCSRKCLRYGM